MMGKRLKEIFGLILINITLVSGSLNAETVYADTQAKIEIEKTEMPLKICVDEENKKTVLQIVAAWKKIYKNNGVELMVIPSGQQASEEKVQEIQNEITTGEGGDALFICVVEKSRKRSGFAADMNADPRRSGERIALDVVDGECVARKLIGATGGFIGGIAFVIDTE